MCFFFHFERKFALSILRVKASRTIRCFWRMVVNRNFQDEFKGVTREKRCNIIATLLKYSFGIIYTVECIFSHPGNKCYSAASLVNIIFL